MGAPKPSETETEVENGPGPDAEPEVSQPGLCRLREAVLNTRLPRLPSTAALRKDGLAGLNTAIANIPDGMANAVLVGVNPIYGLYACMMGPLVGGLFSSTGRMVVTTTAAASLVASQSLSGLPADQRDTALFFMVVMIGALQVLAGVLRLGYLTRFVSYSVMSGFLLGVGVLIVLNQLPIVAGVTPTGGRAFQRAVELFSHPERMDVATLGISALTLVLALTLPRTRLGYTGTLLAIIIPSALVALVGLPTVPSVGELPRGLPELFLPALSDISFEVLTGAPAIAALILVQGAGVSQSVPNLDGTPSRASRDFAAQGLANIASGFLHGLPVGGSMSRTALSVIFGARTRWAVIFSGLWMAVIVILFPALIAHVVTPALGVLLIIAGASAIRPFEVVSIWRTGWPSRLVVITTFVSTLVLPIQAAVGIGVVLSAMVYLTQASTDVTVVELVQLPDGNVEERHPPARLPPDAVTLLEVYGHLFYAGARTLERLLPSPRGSRNPVVVLRLRGRRFVGATLIEVLSAYSEALQAVNGRLYLTGISSAMHRQLIRTAKLRLSGPVQIYEATPIRGESTRRALADARAWLVTLDAGAPGDGPAESAATASRVRRSSP